MENPRNQSYQKSEHSIKKKEKKKKSGISDNATLHMNVTQLLTNCYTKEPLPVDVPISRSAVSSVLLQVWGTQIPSVNPNKAKAGESLPCKESNSSLIKQHDNIFSQQSKKLLGFREQKLTKWVGISRQYNDYIYVSSIDRIGNPASRAW